MGIIAGVDDALTGTPRAKRSLRRTTDERITAPNMSKITLGANVTSDMLAARACPDTDSPKRPVPMDVDTITTPKRRRVSTVTPKLAVKGRKKKLLIPPPNQPSLKDMWKPNVNEDQENSDKPDLQAKVMIPHIMVEYNVPLVNDCVIL